MCKSQQGTCQVGIKVACNQSHPPQHSCNCSSFSVGLKGSSNEEIYQKMANTLQYQLKRKHQQKENQINGLQQEISKMKVIIMRLQNRNKLDRQNQNKLQSQLSQLRASRSQSAEISRQSSRQIRESRQKIRQVIVRQSDSPLQNQVLRLKEKNKGIQQQSAKMTYQLQQTRNQNCEMVQQLKFEREKSQKYKLIIEQCEQQVERLKNKLRGAQETIAFYESECEKLQIQSKKVRIQEKQKIVFRPQTKVETIYIEKPVQKLVYVDVPRTVKQFIQPAQPVVNRIIDCGQKCDCHEQDQNRSRYSDIQIEDMRTDYEDSIGKLQRNIAEYQKERDRLVEVIRARDSELNQLELRVKYMNKRNVPTAHQHSNQPSIVTVTVHKQHHEQTTKNKQPVRNVAQNKDKRPPTSNRSNVRRA